MEITIVENLQRADLNPMEQARAYERLGRDFGMTQEQMAHRVGKDRATVGNFLRLLRLPESVQLKIASGVLSFSHAKVLLTLEHSEEVDPNVRAAQEKLQRALGLRVRIEDNKGRGKVIIEYARLEDFDALMEVLTKES